MNLFHQKGKKKNIGRMSYTYQRYHCNVGRTLPPLTLQCRKEPTKNRSLLTHHKTNIVQLTNCISYLNHSTESFFFFFYDDTEEEEEEMKKKKKSHF